PGFGIVGRMKPRQPKKVYPNTPRRVDHSVFTQIGSQHAWHLQPANGNTRLNEIRQVLPNQGHQYIKPIGIDTAHSTDVRAEMPALYETGQRQLRDGGGMSVEKGTRDGHRLHKLWW